MMLAESKCVVCTTKKEEYLGFVIRGETLFLLY